MLLLTIWLCWLEWLLPLPPQVFCSNSSKRRFASKKGLGKFPAPNVLVNYFYSYMFEKKYFLCVMENKKTVARSVFFFALLFLVAVSIGTTKTASASMTVEAFSGFGVSPENFSGLFHANAPITDNGHEYWDYYLTPKTYNGNPSYNAVLYNTYGGTYITGDGEVVFHDRIDNDIYIFSYTDNYSESPYGYGATEDGYSCNPSGEEQVTCGFITENGIAGLLGSSQDLLFTNNCDSSQGWNSGSYFDPPEYAMCGTWNPSCSPILNMATQCGGGVTPPVTEIACTFDFASIPGWTDPLGMFTGFFTELFDWFGCAFNGLLGIFSGFFTSLASNITSGFSSVFDGLIDGISGILQTLFIPESTFLDTQLDSLKSEFSTQFADLFTFYDAVKEANASTFQDRFSGTLEFRGADIPMVISPFSNVPSFVPIITSFVAFLSLAWFLIHKIPELFGQ